MEGLSHLGPGFAAALSPAMLGALVAGALLGVIAGALPGVGSTAMLAIAIPLAARADPGEAVVAAAALLAGAQLAKATVAMLDRGARGGARPEPVDSDVDAMQIVRQGRAASLVIVATLGALAAGVGAAAIVALLATPLARLALEFGPAEYFSLLLFGLVLAVVVRGGSRLRGAAMVVLGGLLAQVGTATGDTGRFALGAEPISGGIGFGVLAIGLYGVAAVALRLGDVEDRDARPTPASPDPLPLARHPDLRRDIADAAASLVRGTAIGVGIGLVPGAGARLAARLATRVESSVVRQPRRPFGRGAIEAVGAAAAAGVASARASFLPLLAFAVPVDATFALLVAAMAARGMAPGVELMTGQPTLYWSVVASFTIGAIVVAALQWPLARWVVVRTVAYRQVHPPLVVLGCIAAVAWRGRSVDAVVAAVIGAAGIVLARLGCRPGPLLLGFVVVPMLEDNLRRALALSDGQWSTLVGRPLSSGLLAAAAIAVATAGMPVWRDRRRAAALDD